MTEQPDSQRDKTTFREAPIIAIKGFLMGSADIVPGVSGGTIALIVGIYERLLQAINSVNGRFLKLLFSLKLKNALHQIHLLFIVSLLAGIFSAFAFFTRVVPLQVYMFTHPEIVYGLFFGLITGSIYILFKDLNKIGWHELLATAAGIGLGLWVVMLVPTDTPENPAFVFLSGSIAICAMILPGVSGSYLLLILRKYDFLLTQIGNIGGAETLNALINVIPFILGAITGLAVFSRLLGWLLQHYHSITLSVLIGFMIGSLYMIWPFQHREFVEQVRHTEWVDVNNPRVKELEKPVEVNLPEYERLGKRKTENGIERIEVQQVENKLIRSEPFIPGWLGERERDRDRANVRGGLFGILGGFILIYFLEKFREKS